METAQQHRPRWHFGILWHWIVPWLNAPGGAQPGEKQRIRVRDRGPGVLTGHAAAQRGTARPRCAPSPFCSLGRFTCFLSFLAAKPKRIESSLTSPPLFFFFEPASFSPFLPLRNEICIKLSESERLLLNLWYDKQHFFFFLKQDFVGHCFRECGALRMRNNSD